MCESSYDTLQCPLDCKYCNLNIYTYSDHLIAEKYSGCRIVASPSDRQAEQHHIPGQPNYNESQHTNNWSSPLSQVAEVQIKPGDQNPTSCM